MRWILTLALMGACGENGPDPFERVECGDEWSGDPRPTQCEAACADNPMGEPGSTCESASNPGKVFSPSCILTHEWNGIRGCCALDAQEPDEIVALFYRCEDE